MLGATDGGELLDGMLEGPFDILGIADTEGVTEKVTEGIIEGGELRDGRKDGIVVGKIERR